MLTFREEMELHRCREMHLLCLIGWCVSAGLLGLWVAALDWSRLAGPFIAVHAVVALWFYYLSRKPLRRIREIEKFL